MTRSMPVVAVTLRNLVDRRRFWLMVLLAAVPVLIAIVGRAFSDEVFSHRIFDQLVIRTVLPLVEELRQKIGARAFLYDPDVAMISVVGEGLATSPGTAGQVFDALARGGVNIDLISTSSITITCVVRQADVEQGVRFLHQALHLEQEP